MNTEEKKKLAKECFDKGVAHFDKQEYEEAIIHSTESIDYYPHAINFGLRGKCYMELEKYEEATADFSNSIECVPLLANFRARGECYVKLNKHDEAIADFEEVIKLHQEAQEDKFSYAQGNEIIYDKIGRSYAILGNHKKAIENYDKIIAISPKYSHAFYSRGCCQALIANYCQALEDYNEAIDLELACPNIYTDQNLWQYFYVRGSCYDTIRSYEKAIEDYNEALGRSQKNLNILKSRGDSFLLMGNYLKAIDDFRTITSNSLESDQISSAFDSIGICYAYIQDHTQAMTNFNDAISRNPKNKFALYHRSLLYHRNADYQLELADLDMAIEVRKDKEFFYRRGVCYYFLNEYKLAIVDLKQCDKSILQILVHLKRPKNNTDYEIWMAYFKERLVNENHFTTTTKGVTEDIELDLYKDIYIRSLELVATLHVGERFIDNKEPELMVAHYTTEVTAKLLLFKGDNNKISPMRLGTIAKANDPQEGISLLKYLGIDSEPEVGKNRSDYQAFITCFTFNHESLNQFRLYGKKENKEATGVSIVIKKNFFDFGLQDTVKLLANQNENTSIPENIKHSLFRCVYIDPETRKVISVGHREEYTFYRDREYRDLSDDEMKNYILKYNTEISDIKTLVEKGFKELDTAINKVNGHKDSAPIIAELLLQIRYLAKHVAFKEEQECRIISLNDPKIEVRNNNQMYIDYLTLSEAYVYSVCFAPKAEGYSLFRDLLKVNNLDNVECLKSTHPFAG